MGHTILLDFAAFERQVLRLEHSVTYHAALSRGIVAGARLALSKVFNRDGAPTEDAIAKQFLNVLNAKSYGGLLQHHRAVFTGNHAADDGSKSKVDAGFYPKQFGLPDGKPDWNQIRLFIEFKRTGTHLDPFDDFDPDAPEAHAQTRKAVRNQITQYALDMRNNQHRTCIFGLFIIGGEFRVMRYDQSGVIVTKKEDYANDPRLLLSFLAWFDKLTPVQQGMDPTAELLTKDSRAYQLMDEFAEAQATDMEYHEGATVSADYTPCSTEAPNPPSGSVNSPYSTRGKAKAAHRSQEDEPYLDDVELDDGDPRVFQYVRAKFKESLKPDWPRYKLMVGAEKRIFLVGKPIWTAFTLFGRGTRGYIALDVKTRRFTFLKDCWRPFYHGVEPEGLYLEWLNAEALSEPDLRVPTVVVHGDVEQQITFAAQLARSRAEQAKAARRAAQQTPTQAPSTDDVRDRDTAESGTSSQSDDVVDDTFRIYIHYRIVVKDVCLPVSEISSSRQLVSTLRDCMTTHAIAYSNLHLLHRDISAGNMIIRPTLSNAVDENGQKRVMWFGILTDWELAKVIPVATSSEKPKQVPRQPEKTGTWQFMSVAYVRQHPYHLVSVADELESFFHVLLFYAVRLLHHNVANVACFVADYFDHYTVGDGLRRRCSSAKSTAMHSGVIVVPDHPSLRFLTDENPSHSHEALNDLFAQLLGYFKARYAVLNWEEQKSKLIVPADPSPPNTSSSSTADFDLDSERRRPKRSVKRKLDVLNTDEPSPAEKEAARMLDDHDQILDVIWDALDPGKKWPGADVVGDRLKDDYDPRGLKSALDVMYTASGVATTGADPHGAPPPRKKPRTEASEPVVTSAIAHPKRAHTVDGLARLLGSSKSAGDAKGEAHAQPEN